MPVIKIPAAKPVVTNVPEVQADLPDATTKVASNVLAALGLNPFVSSDPVAPVPVDSPAMLAMLAMARKQEDVEEPSMFGRMFGDLEPLNQQTNEELKLIAQGMGEVPGQPAIDNPKGTAAGITFFGQFIDHDLTLDTAPQPDAPVDVNTLVNGRTFAFDLDSVYGGGPQQSPQLYDGDKFKIGVATDGVSPDLPRNPDGKIGNQAMAPQSWWSTATTRTSSSPRSTCRSCGCTTRSWTRACRSMRPTTPW